MIKKTKNKLLVPILSLSALILFSCEKEQVQIPAPIVNQPENITTLKLNIKDSTGLSSIATVQFRDADGPGGNAPVADSLILDKGKSYVIEITILDETKSPVLDLTSEIKDEGAEHQFFYSSTISGLNSSYLDADANNNPLGLRFRLNTPSVASNGEYKVTLKHQPGVKAPAPGDITKGETDIEVTFKTRIK